MAANRLTTPSKTTSFSARCEARVVASGVAAAIPLIGAPSCHLASRTEQGESRTMLWAVLPIRRSKMRLCP